MQNNKEIGCVIVTFNRLEKLKKALEAYAKQEVTPAYIIVVNNASTDGTYEFLENWKQKESEEERCVLNLEKNVGGSGGFYAGQKMAMEKSAEWIMVADDDGYPEPNYIQGIKNYIENHDCDNVAVLCGSLWQNGSNINYHRTVYLKYFADNAMVKPAKIEDLKVVNDLYSIDQSSYVGAVIKKTAMKNVGLCNKEFFIWYDDFEHMYRLGKQGIIGYLPKYKIIHDESKVNSILSWKNYYGVRNKFYFLKNNFYISYLLSAIIFLLKTFLLPLKGRKLKEIYIRIIALYDASRGLLGVHNTYKPGWKP
ncbi:MAG: glycosyltransferase [Clostridia bacterium]|nr:glycosyltransferase [Clostridia bacterium]